MKYILIVVVGAVVLLVVLFQVLTRVSFDVAIERTLAAPPDKIWRFWADADTIQKWWSPKGFSAPVIRHDFQEGGAFLFSMKDPQGKLSWNTGKYTQIVPNQRIASAMSFSDEKGQVVPAKTYGIPGNWPDEIQVTVDFEEYEGKTRIRIQEKGIPGIMYVFAKMGWNQQLDKMEALLIQ